MCPGKNDNFQLSLKLMDVLTIITLSQSLLQFEPSEEAVKVISKLLNATTPFFLADDPLDTEPPTKPQGGIYNNIS